MSFVVAVVVVHLITATKSSPAYTATDIILLNCGASSPSTSLDGRLWRGDSHSELLPSSSATSSATPLFQNPPIPPVPFTSARFSCSPFSYIFPVSPGPKFLRLYFNPSANYSNFNPSSSFFSVKANNYTLLHNFNPPIDCLIKEFIVVVGANRRLTITISPSPNSTAFINGIEIVSLPAHLYTGRDDTGVTLVGTGQPLNLHDSYAFETVYRLNVGGASIDGVNDTGMFRKWLQDRDYVFGGVQGVVSEIPDNATIKYTNATPAFVAPELVYKTKRSMGNNSWVNLNYNLTWIFPVDSGFTYLIRLHFCETRLEVRNVGDEVFTLFIGNQTAEDQIDVISLSGGNSVPVYRDYAVAIPEERGSSRDLWLALHPERNSFKTQDAILNGLEIFKLNDSAGSLAGSNPPPANSPSLQRKIEGNDSKLKLIIIVGSVFFGILAICLGTLVFICKQRTEQLSSKRTETKSFRRPFSLISRLSSANDSPKPHDKFRKFSLFDIQVATGTFDDELVIGSGGFGNVYKGFIDDGVTPVAIKRLHSSSKQGAREFQTEIQLLSQLSHPNLVSLIGYCNDPGEMILVYEYMHRGTLRENLYKTKNPPLKWRQRLEICIGAARGLHYLHTGAKHSVIHRDVKSTNILIDENWVAKVSDFGLSRTGSTGRSESHVSTVVRGSFGYVDPEYYRRQQLTEKSDVYSFGVVLLEVLCARPAVVPGLPREQVNLCDWGRICFRRGQLGKIMDPNLVGDIEPVCLGKFGEIAESCLREKGAERPAMGDIAMELESVLHLQETAEESRIRVDRGASEISREGVMGDTASDDDDNNELFSGSCVGNEESGSTISSVARSEHERLRSNTVVSQNM